MSRARCRRRGSWPDRGRRPGGCVVESRCISQALASGVDEKEAKEIEWDWKRNDCTEVEGKCVKKKN